MRTPNRPALAAAALIGGLVFVGTGTTAALADTGRVSPAPASTEQDTPMDHSDDTASAEAIGGQPAPLIVTPGELAAGITLAPDQALFIADEATAYLGNGGVDNTAIATFTPATTTDDVEYNAGFYPVAVGTTTAWVTNPDGTRTTFTLIIATPNA